MSTSLLDDLICLLYKKGHRLECVNYRGITRFNSALKNHTWDSVQQIETFDSEHKAGIREGRLTTDQMFILRQILDEIATLDGSNSCVRTVERDVYSQEGEDRTHDLHNKDEVHDSWWSTWIRTFYYLFIYLFI